ncbi:glycosyltransferase family 2 protein [Hyphomicrobium sp. DY-1]|uniref:glycosyltransferase family 2 protein n=1 Tax=Hyphomicrobium sp. DY-1 TaxID=3075650 RepID=UPI0039C39134
MPKISIITPTLNREQHLPAIWDCVRSQTIQDVEWLVHGDSVQESQFMKELAEEDDRVHYQHSKNQMWVGAKRNELVSKAKGDTIIHFDDDDYYAPGYIEGMLTFMANSNTDFVKLFGFFLYHQRSGYFGYWDLEVAFPVHYIMDPRLADLHAGPKHRNDQDQFGYGCSYVYAKKVWDRQPFPDVKFGEDQPFAEAAGKAFACAGMQDHGFLMVHVIHNSNSSIVYPQQILPRDVGVQLFPGFTPPAAATVA